MRPDTYALTYRLGSRIIQLSDRAPVAYGPGAIFFRGLLGGWEMLH